SKSQRIQIQKRVCQEFGDLHAETIYLMFPQMVFLYGRAEEHNGKVNLYHPAISLWIASDKQIATYHKYNPHVAAKQFATNWVTTNDKGKLVMHPSRIPKEVVKHGESLPCVQHKLKLEAQASGTPTNLAAKKGEKTYRIKKGDTLWGIAEKHYGSGYLWRKIAEANPDKVKYRDNDIVIILPGHELILPAVDLNEANPEATPKPLAAKTPADEKANRATDGVTCPAYLVKIDPEALKVTTENIPFGPNKMATVTVTYELDVACQKNGPINFSTEISKDSLVVKADIHNFIASMGVTAKGKITMDAGFKFNFLGSEYEASLALSEYRFTPLPGYKATPVAYKGSRKNQVIKQEIGETAFEGKAGVTIYLEVFDKINNNNENMAQATAALASLKNYTLAERNSNQVNITQYLEPAAIVFAAGLTVAISYAAITLILTPVAVTGATAGLITFLFFAENFSEWNNLLRDSNSIKF
ncbi:MAG: LysM peptidoglycan-binding domain-containing protein, partial [SAR324 cluster bacterium]|nr:LysM peptidoglycan-binding domain-containing protein [SAR324 cluster bacterium]